VSILGGGTIDGAGTWWWDHKHHLKIESPRLVELQYVEDFVMRDIHLRDSPFWNVHPYASKRLHFANVTITAQGKGQYGFNTDGIDPDSCQDVLIEDYTYCAGDDAVAIKSGWNWAGQQFNMPSRNITVRRASSGCRGGYTIGSEMSGGVEDVVFEDSISTGYSGIRISSELGRGGYVRNVRFSNISFSWEKLLHDHKQFLLHVNQDYKPDNPNTTLSYFDNITFEAITVSHAPKGVPLGDITCLPQSACTGINFRRIRISDSVEAPVPVKCSGVASGVVIETEGIPKGCTRSNYSFSLPDFTNKAAVAKESPQWELVETSAEPVIGPMHADVLSHGIFNGFETGQYWRSGAAFYYTANELGMCKGVAWDLVTRAALWTAPNSTGPWTRLATLRNGSHIETLCGEPRKARCRVPCGASCCSGTEDEPSFVTWAPTLLHAASSVNTTKVWQLFYSSNQNSHYGDQALNGITWAVSTTDSMMGPYVDVVGRNGTELPPGGEGVRNIAVNASHSFSAWQLRNGSWAGFRNNIPGAKSFSAGLIVPAGDPAIPGGAWRQAGPNLASGSDCDGGFCYAPENPVVTTMSTDGRYYLAVYDALEQPPLKGLSHHRHEDDDDDGTAAGVCGSENRCNRIGVGFSADGVTWQHSGLVAVQSPSAHPCGQIRTPLGMAPEPERCRGCYSVLWTGITGGSEGFRPVCRAIIRNVNE